jgi:hypothetical protein
MARKKTSLGTTARRPALRAAADLARDSARQQLVAAREVRPSARVVGTVAATAGLPRQLVDGLMKDADATTGTFVVVAYPSPLTGRVLLDTRVRELAQAHDRVLQQIKELVDQGAGLDARYAELKRTVDRAIGKMDRLSATLEAAAARDRRVQPSLAAAHQRLASERVKLEAIGCDMKNFRYEQLIRRVRVLVEATLPKGALALVVSKGDERLLALHGRRAWHFLRNEQGVYAGHHPADSAAAIEALDRWRAAGAAYLVIPQVAFWWLDHYAAFRQHLDRRGRIVVRDDRTAVIYALQKAKHRR